MQNSSSKEKLAFTIAFVSFIVILLFSLFGCNSGGGAKAPSLPSEPSCKKSVKDTIEIKDGDTFDGGGCLYTWTGSGDCGQKETSYAMFRLGKNSRLKNLHIKDAPDGVHLMEDGASMDKVVFRNVCEDAVTVRGSNQKITNSWFNGGSDKVVQGNCNNPGPKRIGVNVLGNTFIGGGKGVRFGPNCLEWDVNNNKFYNTHIAIHNTGGTGFAQNNEFYGTKFAFQVEREAVLRVKNSKFEGVGTKYEYKDKGKIIEE